MTVPAESPAAQPPAKHHVPQLPAWYPWVNTVIQVALVVVVVILLLQNSRLSKANQQNLTEQHNSSIQQCQLANTTRLQDIAIWNRILSVIPADPAGRKFVADLKPLVKVKDTPRNCAAAYPQR